MDVFIRDGVKSKLGYIMKEEKVVAVKAIKRIGYLSCCYRHYPLAS